MTRPESAKEAYDRYAAVYDECNAQNDYEMWLGEALLPELERHGLRKGRVLDVGCGTGRAFDPLMDRGWEVVGCDVSGGMLEEARRKFGSRVRLFEADARGLPAIDGGETFDLVLLLNDVVNYLTDEGDLEKVFAGVGSNLRGDRGLALFDVNTVALFRNDFASGVTEEIAERGWEWRGMASEAKPGLVYEAELSGRGVEPHVHRQRHWTQAQIGAALELAGLRPLAVLGQREEATRVRLSDAVDEERDAKIVYIAAPADAPDLRRS